jgi:hypothetical protein
MELWPLLVLLLLLLLLLLEPLLLLVSAGRQLGVLKRFLEGRGGCVASDQQQASQQGP